MPFAIAWVGVVLVAAGATLLFALFGGEESGAYQKESDRLPK